MRLTPGRVLLLLGSAAIGEFGRFQVGNITHSSWLALDYLVAFGSIQAFSHMCFCFGGASQPAKWWSIAAERFHAILQQESPPAARLCHWSSSSNAHVCRAAQRQDAVIMPRDTFQRRMSSHV